jgi:hypothetical protein
MAKLEVRVFRYNDDEREIFRGVVSARSASEVISRLDPEADMRLMFVWLPAEDLPYVKIVILDEEGNQRTSITKKNLKKEVVTTTSFQVDERPLEGKEYSLEDLEEVLIKN